MYIAQTHLWLSSLLRHVSVADGAKIIQHCHKGPGAGDFRGYYEHDPWLL